MRKTNWVRIIDNPDILKLSLVLKSKIKKKYFNLIDKQMKTLK